MYIVVANSGVPGVQRSDMGVGAEDLVYTSWNSTGKEPLYGRGLASFRNMPHQVLFKA
jgi:hypothetical protein